MERITSNFGSRPEKLNAAELLKRLKETGVQINKAVIRSIPLTGLLLTAMPAAQQSTYGYEVTSEIDHGNKRWHHEDKETEQMIEYMAGLGPIPERYMLMQYKKTVLTYLAGKIDSPPADWEDFTKEDVDRFWLSQFTKEDLYNAPSDFVLKDFVKEVGDSLMRGSNSIISFSGPNTLPDEYQSGVDVSNYELDETGKRVLYEKLWRLEEMCGGAKIRPLEESDSEGWRSKERAYYQALTHTMYINIHTRDLVNNNFAAELAHACQQHLKPYTANNQALIDHISVSAYAIQNGMSFGVAYDELLYDKKGSAENEAHREMEPKIKKFLDDNRKVATDFNF